MAEVVSRGYPKPRIARHQCQSCDSVVDYMAEDVQTDQRQETYVVCPVCNYWIATDRLRWQFTAINNDDPDQEPVWDPRLDK